MYFWFTLGPFFGSGLEDPAKTFASGSGFSLVWPVGGLEWVLEDDVGRIVTDFRSVMTALASFLGLQACCLERVLTTSSVIMVSDLLFSKCKCSIRMLRVRCLLHSHLMQKQHAYNVVCS